MATFKTYEEISAWQMGRELVKQIYALTRKEPFSKDYGLKDQIQRAAVSVCSNIAEGFERRGNREFVKFLWIAKGSAAEVGSQLYNARDIGYISMEDFDAIMRMAKDIAGKIQNLIKSITSSTKGLAYIRD